MPSESVQNLIDTLVPIDNAVDWTEPQIQIDFDEDFNSFLHSCNGGYTRDGFIHLFGTSGPPSHDLLQWNQSQLWKKYYGLGDSFLIFAEDVFGNQYGFDLTKSRSKELDFNATEGPEGNLKYFMVDNATLIACADSFDSFIEWSIFSSESDELRDLLRAFNQSYGPVSQLHHLSARKPLVLGGDGSSIHNLEVTESVSNLRFLGHLVMQVKQLTPGTMIKRVDINHETAEVRLIT